jgi:hypothetical protein
MAEAMPFQNKIRRLRPADKLVEEVKKQTSGAKAQIYLQRLIGTSELVPFPKASPNGSSSATLKPCPFSRQVQTEHHLYLPE